MRPTPPAKLILCILCETLSAIGAEGRGFHAACLKAERDDESGLRSRSGPEREERGSGEGRHEGKGAMADSGETSSTKTPADFLKSIKGQQVLVKLNSGSDYKGVLACLDGYMNIAMEQTEEYVNGKLTNKYGDCFIRGNNVLYIHAKRA